VQGPGLPVFLLASLLGCSGSSQVCDRNTYGSDPERISLAMFDGDVAATTAALLAGMESRGTQLGCAELEVPRDAIDDTPADLTGIRDRWSRLHGPALATYPACPDIGRAWPAAGLGGHYARLAGVPVDEGVLAAIADDAAATQYGPATVGTPTITPRGVYAIDLSISDAGSPCRRTGSLGKAVEKICDEHGEAACITYTEGEWAGRRFVVADVFPDANSLDGGLSYDHAWTAAMMLEHITQLGAQADPELVASFLLAAQWAADEPALRNHNYTAKDIWVLALAYNAFGELDTRAALLDKLDRSLLPGVLMDADEDGIVDGTEVRFADLAEYAQRPGRMWDGHNALQWYHAMNTWALVESYVAFRDRGDDAEAERVRPYMEAMLDNLSWELTNLGPVNAGEPRHPTPWAFATALWKVADYEDTPRPEWERAAWVLWNTPHLDEATGNRTTAHVGLYLVRASGVPYVPYAERMVIP